MRLSIILISLFLSSQSWAQSGDIPGGPSAGMAGAGLGMTNAWSFYQNQAGLADIEGIESGAFYQSRFLTSELGFQGLTAAMPVGNGTMAVGFQSFGYSQFRESQYGLAYAMRLSEELNIGVGLDYSALQIGEGYGSTSAFLVQLGFQYDLNDKLKIAGHVFNPTRSKLNDYDDERIPSVLRGGINYEVSTRVIILAEVAKDVDQKASTRIGLTYWPSEQFVLRAGVRTAPVETSFGFGARFSAVQIDLASSYHYVLGFSPSIALTFNASRK